MKQLRGMTTSIFHIDELTDSTEDVIFEAGGVTVSAIKYVKQKNNFYVAVEKGELYRIDYRNGTGDATVTIEFRREHNGVVNCPGIVEEALLELLRHRLKAEEERTGSQKFGYIAADVEEAQLSLQMHRTL